MPPIEFIPVADLDLIRRRLPILFPEGVPNRQYVVRDIAARTVFVMLYCSAVEGHQRWIGPRHVYCMNDRQAARQTNAARQAWCEVLRKPGYRRPARSWYADNSREPIRDETLRHGLIPIGAVVERSGLATTSSLPRYALSAEFAGLFLLDAKEFPLAAERWRASHLSREALARQRLVALGSAQAGDAVLVTLPSGETRRLLPGLSSVIAKAVIEQFAPRFLHQPALLWLSEPGNKVPLLDNRLAGDIGLRIEADRHLPDIILVDLGARPKPRLLLVFVEVVATDGPIHQQRKNALAELAQAAGFDASNLCFVTAFLDRADAAYRRVVSELAWGSFAWFASEPAKLVVLEADNDRKLSHRL